MNKLGEGIYRFIAVANDLKNITGTTGGIVKIAVSTNKNTPTGEYTGYFRNIKLSKTNGEGNSYGEFSFPIIIVNPSVATANSYTRKYGEENPTFEYKDEGGTLYGSPEIECNATIASPVGIYPIVIKQGSIRNDSVTYINGTLTITKAPLSIATEKVTYTKKQGDPIPEFTLSYTGFKNNDTKEVLTKQPTVTCDATEASEPGEYPISVSGAEAQNYDISYTNGKLIVINADAVVIKAKSYTRKYGDANPTLEYTVEGAALQGTPEIVCEANALSAVGTYDIVVKPGTVKNYNVTYVNGTLTVEKAPLNIAAGTYTKKQGEPMPEFTLTYNGFKNNDTKEVLTKQPTVTCDATEASAPGEYPISVSGAEAQNYDISYKVGKLIVTEVEGITEIATDEQSLIVYTALGKRILVTSLKSLPRGIYIVNGKKTIVR
ncbi:MAG: hypothetical protein K6G08_11115 [Prevotella sp.]|nr:hypothetical protein [Prevotella sp.]